MRYLIYLHNANFRPIDANELLRKARYLARNYDVIIRDVRVASNFLEYDVTLNKDILQNVIDLMSNIAPSKNIEEVVEHFLCEEEIINMTKKYFNSERYWSAHEVLESLWKNSKGFEKDLLNGIILTCAAFVHYQKDESDICLSIFARAMKKFGDYNGKYKDFDIKRIKDDINIMIYSKNIRNITI